MVYLLAPRAKNGSYWWCGSVCTRNDAYPASVLLQGSYWGSEKPGYKQKPHSAVGLCFTMGMSSNSVGIVRFDVCEVDLRRVSLGIGWIPDASWWATSRALGISFSTAAFCGVYPPSLPLQVGIRQHPKRGSNLSDVWVVSQFDFWVVAQFAVAPLYERRRY